MADINCCYRGMHVRRERNERQREREEMCLMRERKRDLLRERCRERGAEVEIYKEIQCIGHTACQ